MGIPKTTFPVCQGRVGNLETLARISSEGFIPFRGFNKYGNMELEPKRMNTVWIKPEFLKLRGKAKRPPIALSEADLAMRRFHMMCGNPTLPSTWKRSG